MAPRGRTKKVGLRRMDAAIDALKPMGYSSDFVRRKVRELLKVYGDEGWTFIEEASYSLLINYILEDDNAETFTHGEPSSMDDRDQGTAGDEPSQAEPSSEANVPLCSSQEAPLLSPVTVLNPDVSPLGRRKSYFGWIGPNGDDDYVLLKHAPVHGWKTSERRRKRKSRWDVGPDDVL